MLKRLRALLDSYTSAPPTNGRVPPTPTLATPPRVASGAAVTSTPAIPQPTASAQRGVIRIAVAGQGSTEPPSGGCKDCQSASANTCGDHLGYAAPLIAQAFKDAEVIFNPDNPECRAGVARLLPMIAGKDGEPLGLQMPTDPTIRTRFMQQIAAASQAQPR